MPIVKPKEALAVAPDSNTKLEPSPMMMLPSVGVKPAISANCASYACTSEPIAKPKLVLALEADVAPVPPFATAIVEPFHVPVVIVPSVVIED